MHSWERYALTKKPGSTRVRFSDGCTCAFVCVHACVYYQHRACLTIILPRLGALCRGAWSQPHSTAVLPLHALCPAPASLRLRTPQQHTEESSKSGRTGWLPGHTACLRESPLPADSGTHLVQLCDSSVCRAQSPLQMPPQRHKVPEPWVSTWSQKSLQRRLCALHKGVRKPSCRPGLAFSPRPGRGKRKPCPAYVLPVPADSLLLNSVHTGLAGHYCPPASGWTQSSLTRITCRGSEAWELSGGDSSCPLAF